jgi:hypothetical protein
MYMININYEQNIKRDAKTSAQCKSRVLCRYHIGQKPHDQNIELELRFIHFSLDFWIFL